MTEPKVWIDTNIIIRFITADHPVMTAQTAEVMKRAEEGKLTLKVAAMIVAECCWVLQSANYGFSKKDIASVLTSFLTAKGIEAEEKNVVIKSLERYAEKNIDFIDAYLAERAKSLGPDFIITYNAKDFDKLNIRFEKPPFRKKDCDD